MSSSERVVLLPKADGGESTEYKTYCWRWVMLLIIWFLNFSNGMMWITFTPIADATAVIFDITEYHVNLLSIMFMVAYIPLGFISQWVLGKYFAYGLIFGAWLNLIGAWLRYGSIFFAKSVPGIVMLFGGQFLAACAQPFVLNAPPKMANLWFTPEGRATADMIGTIGNIIGIGVGQAISPILAGITSNSTFNETQEFHPSDTLNPPNMAFMLAVFAGIASVVGLFATFFTREKPKTPPSAAAEHESDGFVDGMKQLYKNIPYMGVLVTFGIGTGIFNAITTLLSQILRPIGYTDDQAGLFGALIVGVGLVGAIVVAPLLDWSHKYKEIYGVAFIFSFAGFLWFTFIIFAVGHSDVQVGLSVGMVGLGAFIILPTALELSVETTYPVAPVTSAGFLWMVGQIVGIAALFASEAIRTNAPDEKTGIERTLLLMCGLLFVGVIVSILMLFVPGIIPHYRRVEMEERAEKSKIFAVNHITERRMRKS